MSPLRKPHTPPSTQGQGEGNPDSSAQLDSQSTKFTSQTREGSRYPTNMGRGRTVHLLVCLSTCWESPPTWQPTSVEGPPSEHTHPPFLPISVPGRAEIQEFRTASCIQGHILFYHAWVWCGCEAGRGASVGVSPELRQRGGPRVAPTAQSWELLPHP